MHKFILPALLLAFATSTALAAPVLKADVSVNHPVITVGDMFSDAGLLAERALFRAPEPGTTGIVSLDAVRAAARKAGLTDYSQEGLLSVRVERRATVVDTTVLSGLISADLAVRGLLPQGGELHTRFDNPSLSYNAEAVETPVTLLALRYQPGAASFAARFQVAGMDLPVDVSGSIDLLVEVPHLAASLKAGAVLSPADIEMKRVSLAFADQSGVENLNDLVGKQLRRNSRAGVMLKAADVTEPLAVRRNTEVTVLLRTGPMTLTVVGQSLGDAATGQPVQVMNSVSRKILNGVATANGAVEITTAAAKLQVAGL
ncbi:flagella basal body P-ring formation protein FlgA [Devosia insulae DS-56]|uniref:Flagella basal body P-ring formation protein FlgA n=1 Tax=Devosia insulae DS-56 TaxID=1116389 RepID=A0A1E5XNT3_9HYPH|nr:flagellar basal body P-ring formation chaperone FlgA [Devosia insulae]OEO30164.1 flagella basal body P-ring formation protein FlgA [Devosia insulae DS-56]